MPANGQPATAAEAAEPVGVGDQVEQMLVDLGVTTAFGVVSIHNMPILDAIYRKGRIRFVTARSESGAINMADAYARVTRGLGVAVTSTGTGAGNAGGSMVEALSAGSPVLHITGQVERPFLDRDRGAVHDAPKQTAILEGMSKAVYRVWEPRSAAGMLAAAAQAALAAPRGPVSIEFPIDVQHASTPAPLAWAHGRAADAPADPALLDRLAELVSKARRPMLWLGGGAREAAGPARALVARGFCAAASTNGRGIVPESEPGNLGSFTVSPEARALFAQADLMIVAGSRLRGRETGGNSIALPRPLIQIDADPTQGGRNYEIDMFIQGEAAATLSALLDRLPPKLDVDAGFRGAVQAARGAASERMLDTLGPYRAVAQKLAAMVPAGPHPFVRDVTIANTTFGNSYVGFSEPRLGVHAVGGGIGQGVAMAIGAALAEAGGKTVALVGDGGAVLNLGEFLTAVETRAQIVYVLMNDQGYGIIKNIQNARYGGRTAYSPAVNLDFGAFAASAGMAHRKVAEIGRFDGDMDWALSVDGPVILEVDMVAIGPYSRPFSGITQPQPATARA